MIHICDVQQLQQKLAANEAIKLIDCRELSEWNEAHIEKAILVPLSEFEKKYETVLKDKNEPVYIQCRSGKRSMNACLFLLSKGYTNLFNVDGGIISWVQSGYPIKTQE